jgi:hypothetical protein
MTVICCKYQWSVVAVSGVKTKEHPHHNDRATLPIAPCIDIAVGLQQRNTSCCVPIMCCEMKSSFVSVERISKNWNNLANEV